MALTDNILAAYNLDESSGNAADSSGNGNTLTNTNSVSYTTGLISNCADFGTANTNKALLSSSGIGYGGSNNSGSISMWVKVQTEPSSGTLYTLVSMNGGSAPSNTRIVVRYQNSAGTRNIDFIRQSSGTNNDVTYNTNLGTTSWHHIVITYDGSTILGYLDGAQVATLGSTFTLGTDPAKFAIGANPEDTTQQPTSAYMDMVYAWSRAITSGEVTTLYNSGAGSQYPFVGVANNAISFGHFA